MDTKFAKRLRDLDATEMTSLKKEFLSATVGKLKRRKSRNNKSLKLELQLNLKFSKNQIRRKKENLIKNSTKMKSLVRSSVVAAEKELRLIKEVKISKSHNKNITEERAKVMTMMTKMQSHLLESKA